MVAHMPPVGTQTDATRQSHMSQPPLSAKSESYHPPSLRGAITCANACGRCIYNDPIHTVCERPRRSDAAISHEPMAYVAKSYHGGDSRVALAWVASEGMGANKGCSSVRLHPHRGPLLAMTGGIIARTSLCAVLAVVRRARRTPVAGQYRPMAGLYRCV